MKKVEYICNMCTEVVQKDKMVAYYWKSDTIPQRYVLDESKINDCDKHICEDCIHNIQKYTYPIK